MLAALSISKFINVCDCCHKTKLKQTIKIVLESNKIVHYCKSCTCKLTGKSMQDIIVEIRKIQHSIIELAKEEYFSSNEYKNLIGTLKINTCNQVKINSLELQNIRKLAKNKKEYIANKYHISTNSVSIV